MPPNANAVFDEPFNALFLSASLAEQTISLTFYALTPSYNLCMPGEYRQYIHSFAVVAERILRLLRHEKTDIGGKKPTTPPLLLYLI